MSEPWTTLTLIQWTKGYFEKGGIPNPRLDAELLLAYLLKCQRIELYTHHEKRIGEKDLAKFKELIQRRAKREPLQYIIGETEFYGLKFKVTPDVLIPRPETELLVEEGIRIWRGCLSEVPRRKLSQAAVTLASKDTAAESAGGAEPAGGEATAGSAEETGDKHPCQILEIGTGSGCIAITLAKHLPNAKIIATDISKAALEIARENARRHEVEHQIEFLLADIAPWRVFQTEGRQFDLIVSNPPYIPTNELEELQPEITLFEPRGALDGGPEGLDVIRKILIESTPFLKPGSYLLLEIGEGQGKQIGKLLEEEEEKLRLKEIKPDLNGAPRVLIAQKPDDQSRLHISV